MRNAPINKNFANQRGARIRLQSLCAPKTIPIASASAKNTPMKSLASYLDLQLGDNFHKQIKKNTISIRALLAF